MEAAEERSRYLSWGSGQKGTTYAGRKWKLRGGEQRLGCSKQVDSKKAASRGGTDGARAGVGTEDEQI